MHKFSFSSKCTKKSAPSTAGGGQHNLELASVIGEAELAFAVRDFVGIAHWQDCLEKFVQQGCLVLISLFASLTCSVVQLIDSRLAVGLPCLLACLFLLGRQLEQLFALINALVISKDLFDFRIGQT